MRFAVAWLLVLACGGPPSGGDDPTPSDESDTEVPDATDDTDVSDTEPSEDTGEPPGPRDTIVACGTTLTPPSPGRLCHVRAGDGDATLYRGVVLLPEGGLDGGSVLLDADGLIACVGCDCAGDPDFATATVVDCPDVVISPGLVNPHEHLTFSESAPLPPSDVRYDHRHGWRGAVSTPQNPSGASVNGAGNRWVELRHVVAGTTTIVGSGRAGGMARNPDDREPLGAPLPEVVNETFPLDDSNERFRADCTWSYRDSEREIAGMAAYVPHVAEGIDTYAAEEFRCQSRSTDGAIDAVESNVAHVHGIGLDAADWYRMARDRAKLVWSPRSNVSLYGHTANVRLFATLGGTIALGTDWTYTGSANLLRELACADQLNRDHYDGFFSDADLWRMVTSGAAESIGARAVLGALEPGLVGDLALFDAREHRDHRAVLEAGSQDVVLVVRGGEPLFGEAGTMADLGRACDAVTVCGDARQVCVQDEFGLSYATLAAQTTGAYPLFFCDDVPPDEPTCTPSRPGEFTGVPNAEDADGDGIPDVEDACPRVFDPIRPIDGGAQPDADQDGLGDACDPTPLPPDLDGDGRANLLDVCPFDDDDGLDADSDGKGDVCDACPEVANPDRACRAVDTIPTARARGAGAVVTVQGTVTGVGAEGFTVQDPAVTNGRNAGIYVFLGRAPTVRVGAGVEVAGTVSSYFGELQLGDASVTPLGTGTVVNPVALTVAEAVDEAYEGVLVRLTDGAVTDSAYDCSADAGACRDAGLWEVGGGAGLLVDRRYYSGTAWDDRVGDLPVTGVMSWRWDRRRLLPRTDADFGP